MKMKKIVAGVAAAMAVTSMAAMSVSAIAADSTVIDFEDGDCSFVYMNDFDGGTKATIEVADYNGSKQLKVTPENGALYSKIWFDLDKITARTNTVQIGKITFDVAVAPNDEEGIVGWVGGSIGAAGGFDSKNIQASQANPKWSQAEVSFDGSLGYNPGEAAVGKGEKKFLMPSDKYTAEGTNPFFCLMLNPADAASRDAGGYTNNYSTYVDNIKLFDAKGTELPLGVAAPAEETTVASEETTAAAEETTTAAEETTAAAEEATTAAEADAEAPAETTEAATEAATEVATEAATTAAPVAAPTTSAATGNVAVASIVAVMAVAGAAAIASKKRK